MIGFKTELKLNNQQRTMMAKHAGVARHAYNWGLAVTKQILIEQLIISVIRVQRSKNITSKVDV